MKLSREIIQRMIDGRARSGGGGSRSSGFPSDYASQAWCLENFVSIEFFNRLFTINAVETSGGVVTDIIISPNDVDSFDDENISEISLQAMFGFWTEQYVSALGQGSGGGGGGGTALNQPLLGINNAGLGTPTASNVAIAWNGSQWTYADISTIDMTQVWTALGAVDSSKQIDASHLTTALSGYLTTADAAATYLSIADAATTYLSIDFFNRLFTVNAVETSGGVVTDIIISPNDVDSFDDANISEISLQAMFGFWTEQYVSALGQGSGGGGGGGTALNQPLLGINNAGLGTPTDANVAIAWNGSQWVYTNVAAVASAIKLQTARNIWGQPFDGTADVTGAMTGVTSVDGFVYYDSTNGRIGINNTAPLASLDISGALFVRRQSGGASLRIGVDSNDYPYIQTYDASRDANYVLMIYDPTAPTIAIAPMYTSSGYLPHATDIYGSAVRIYSVSADGTDATVSLFAKANGYIGIGGISSASGITHPLTVNGNVYASGYVTAQNSASYVLLSDGTSALISGLSVGDATTLGGTAKGDLFSALTTDGNAISATIGGTTKTVTAPYATNAGTLGGTAKGGLFTTLANSSNKLSITVGGTNKTLTVAYATNAGSADSATTATYLGSATKTVWGQNWLSSGAPQNVDGTIYVGKGVSSYGSWAEGIRLYGTSTSGSWSGIQFGCNRSATTGSHANQWSVARSADNHFMITNNDNTGAHGIVIRQGTYNVGINCAQTNTLLTSTIHYSSSETTTGYKFAVNGGAYAKRLHVNLTVGSTFGNGYTLAVDGEAKVTGLYSTGYVTALSDARHKSVVGATGLTVAQIAEAPAIRFLWTDRADDSLNVGSIAQYWQKVLPEVVRTASDGTLSLDYGVTALVASIITARKVETHEQRIARLEEENQQLRAEIAELKK